MKISNQESTLLPFVWAYLSYCKKSFHACWVFIKNPYYMKFLNFFWLHVACLIFQWKFCCIYARNYGGVVGNLIIGLWKKTIFRLFFDKLLLFCSLIGVYRHTLICPCTSSIFHKHYTRLVFRIKNDFRCKYNFS